MKKQIGICALIAVLVLVAVGCASFTEETEYITNTAFITAVEEETDIDWTKEENGTVPLTRENLKAIRAVTELDINHKKLTDLSGIEWFSELEVLNCSDNRLTELDLSQNSNLWSLRCNSNQLRSLDLSQNTTLKDLECNSNQLTELDLSHNLALTKLHCYKNQLRSLDLSHNTALEELYCGSQKTSGGEVQQLTLTLTSEQREKWDSIWADATDEDANNYDVAIEVRNSGAENHPDTATDTTAEYITNTAFITAVEKATDINWTKEEDGTVPLTPENLEAIQAIKKLDISDMELTDLSGIEWFTGLEVLDCSDNLLTELDLSQNSNLWSLRCNSNQLTELDLSHNTALIELYCYANQLTELDLSHNTALEDLDCGGNQLRSLDLSKNTKLRSLYCHSNQLTELDLSHNTTLIWLFCQKNQLKSLDVSQNTALGWLYCFNNQLSDLDLSLNTALEELYCGSQKTSGNKVQELTLTLTSEQREKWDSIWVDATDEDANNYDVTIEE